MPHLHGSDATGGSRPLRPEAVRWARASRRYEETVRFYRDLLGLAVLDEFRSSHGEDGTVFGLPDTPVHMEILRAHPAGDAVGSSDQLVLYLADAAAVARATAPLRAAGHAPDRQPHPYWEANGAVSYRDPDGRGVVFAPWAYGRVPDPVDRPEEAGVGAAPSSEPGPDIDWYVGDRAALRHLFEEAEDSARLLDEYLEVGRLLVAHLHAEVVGHLQLVETGREGEIELKSMAVEARLRGAGIGTRLVNHALDVSRSGGYARMVVATAAADIDNLRFYQRRGFRFTGVEPDAFGVDTGYAEGLTIDGISLRDRIWFTQLL